MRLRQLAGTALTSRPNRAMYGLFVCGVGVMLISVWTRAQDDCVTCMPERNEAKLSGSYKVCIEPGTFSPVQKAAVEKGAQHWSGHLGRNGYTVSMTFSEESTTNSGCDMKVYAMSLGAAAEALVTPDGKGAEIRVNDITLWRTDENYWNEILGHEWGHIFGLRNVDDRPGCVGYTLMTSGYNVPRLGYLPEMPLCGDNMSIGETYSSQTTSGGEETREPAEGEDLQDCWDVYWVHTEYYIWSDGHVTQGPSWSTYLYTECYGELE